MTMKLPEKAGFVPTVAEWDALVRIAENLAAQLAQRDAAQREMQAERDAAQSSAGFWGRSCAKIMAERDAARAEVARLDALLRKFTCRCVYNDHHDGCTYAALRQPAQAPAQPLDDDGVCECGHSRGQHRGVCMIFPCKCMEFTAPAQGQE